MFLRNTVLSRAMRMGGALLNTPRENINASLCITPASFDHPCSHTCLTTIGETNNAFNIYTYTTRPFFDKRGPFTWLGPFYHKCVQQAC